MDDMKLDPDVTTDMIAAGNKIAGQLTDASIAKCMNGLGGSQTWEQFVEQDFPNRDLVLAYLEERMDSVTCIYTAMSRVAK